jgi:hypothetical protein
MSVRRLTRKRPQNNSLLTSGFDSSTAARRTLFVLPQTRWSRKVCLRLNPVCTRTQSCESFLLHGKLSNWLAVSLLCACVDVNMEHVQLLLLLLHSLQMNQRKALLLQLAQVIVRVSDTLAQYVMFRFTCWHLMVCTR